MTHIAIQEQVDGQPLVGWMEKVGDDQYRR